MRFPSTRARRWAVGRLIEEIARDAAARRRARRHPVGRGHVPRPRRARRPGRRRARLCSCCAWRGPSCSTSESLGQAPTTVEHRGSLQPLSNDDSGRLVESLLDGGSLDDAARARIVDASDGLPLFVEEMVAMLIDEGALRRDDGRWVAADLSRIAAPATIHALLAARSISSNRRNAQCSNADQSRARCSTAAPSSFCRPRTSVPASRVGCRARAEGADRARGAQSSRKTRRTASIICFSAMSPTSRCRRNSARSCTSASRSGSTTGLVSARASTTRSPAITSEQAVRYQTGASPREALDSDVADRAGARLGERGYRAHARGDWAAAVSLALAGVEAHPGGRRAMRRHSSRSSRMRSCEIAPASRRAYRSMRCFWSWPLGHSWTVRDRGGQLVLRCAACGKERSRMGGFDIQEGEISGRTGPS